MKVQRAILPDSKRLMWLVIGDDSLPVPAVQSFLSYLHNIGRSPNTIRSYAHHLKLFWEYLTVTGFGWRQLTIKELSDFMSWLRDPQPIGVTAIHERTSCRSEVSINTILAAVTAFYVYHQRLGTIQDIPLYGFTVSHQVAYKGLLHGIAKEKPAKRRLLKLKVPKQIPKTLTTEQVGQVIDACHRLRDKFLLCLLYETGMRIGQALGLRHQDIDSRQKVMHIIPRLDHPHGVRTKTHMPYSVHVSPNLIRLYADYLVDEVQDVQSDFVFVNLWHEPIGKPMTPATVEDLFRRLSKKTGIKIHPHVLRHTHATELLRAGWGLAYVQRRLGHVSIQTTANTYAHLTDEDLHQAYQKYLQVKEGKKP